METMPLFVVMAYDENYDCSFPAKWEPRNPPPDSGWPPAPGGLDHVFFWDEDAAAAAITAYVADQDDQRSIYPLSVERWDVPLPPGLS